MVYNNLLTMLCILCLDLLNLMRSLRSIRLLIQKKIFVSSEIEMVNHSLNWLVTSDRYEYFGMLSIITKIEGQGIVGRVN